MNAGKVILGLVPFALFAVLGAWLPIGVAALIGMAAAIVAIFLDLKAGVKLIPVLAVVVLGVFAVLGFTAGGDVQHALADYGRGLATLVLAAYMLITAPFAPFTAQYARETVPRQYWKSAQFRTTNRRISAAWGLTVLAAAVCHFIAEALVASGAGIGPIVLLALNWGVPIFAILSTIKYTKKVVADAPSGAVNAGA